MSGNMMKLCCFEIYLRICGEERLHPQLPPGFLYNCQNQIQVNFSFNAQKKISDQVNLGQIRLEVFKCQTPLGQLYINFKFDQIIYKFPFAQLTTYFVFEYFKHAVCLQIFVLVDFNFVFLTLFNIICIFCIFYAYSHGNQVGSNFSYFSSFLFEYFFSFVFCIFATCGMGTSRGRHQQSSFPVFLQMQPCISGKSNLLFFSNTIRSFDHQMSAFVIYIYMCPACNVHSKSTKREVHLCPLRLGQNGILETI